MIVITAPTAFKFATNVMEQVGNQQTKNGNQNSVRLMINKGDK